MPRARRREKKPDRVKHQIESLERALRAVMGRDAPTILAALSFCYRFHGHHQRPASLEEIVAHFQAEAEREADRRRGVRQPDGAGP